MKVKPIKIKIKQPTKTAADRLYAKHQAIRKAKGLPDSSEYKKKLEGMKEGYIPIVVPKMIKEPTTKKPEPHIPMHPAKEKAIADKKAGKTYKNPYPFDKNKSAPENANHNMYKATYMHKEETELNEMDKSAPQPGRDGNVSHRTYGSRDTTGETGKQVEGKPIKAKKAVKDALSIMKKIRAEHVEQLDEISAELKASYVAGAKKQIKQSMPFTKKSDEYRDIAKNFIAKRKKGIAKANEEVEQIDEISRDTLLSYANKVSLDSQKHSKDPTRRSAEKANRSVAGYAKAINRLENPVKEDTELDEQLYKKARFVSGPAKKPFKSNTTVTPQNEGFGDMIKIKKKGTNITKEINPDAYSVFKHHGFRKEEVVEEGAGDENHVEMQSTKLSRKAQIVKDAAKGKKSKQDAKDEASDKFQKDPELSSNIHKT